jgi:hypothetical protein
VPLRALRGSILRRKRRVFVTAGGCVRYTWPFVRIEGRAEFTVVASPAD